MALRIKELCKEKHTTMADVAKKIGIHAVTLTQSLNGNPTLSRLQEVADVLEVDVSELFEQPVKESVYGCLYVNGKPVVLYTKEDLLKVLKSLRILTVKTETVDEMKYFVKDVAEMAPNELDINVQYRAKNLNKLIEQEEGSGQ